jgi:hypothetical protein
MPFSQKKKTDDNDAVRARATCDCRFFWSDSADLKFRLILYILGLQHALVDGYY